MKCTSYTMSSMCEEELVGFGWGQPLSLLDEYVVYDVYEKCVNRQI
jgi:hypothetical protein